MTRLITAGQAIEKGDAQNLIPDEGIARIAATFIQWKEDEIRLLMRAT